MRQTKTKLDNPRTWIMNSDDSLAAERIGTGMLLKGEIEKQYTVEDARKKLEAEFEVFKDGDSRYVIKTLIERSETDHKLLQGIMQPDKSYNKAFQYFFQQSRRVGYKLPYGNLVFLDNDSAVQLAVEYFRGDKKPELPKRKKRPGRVTVKPKTENESVCREPNRTPEVIAATEDTRKKTEGTKKKGIDIDGQLSLFGLM